MAGDGRLITAIVRGDRDVNETKLSNVAKVSGGLRPATVDEIHAAGMEPGYGSAVGAHDTFVVVDELAARSPNLVAGANRVGFHLRNVNLGRDFQADLVADIDNAREGDACPVCGHPVILRNGIEVGNIFKLGTRYSAALGATYLGEDGQAHPIVMGSYGIGLGRNVACIVEAHHDEKGIAWPDEVAPYPAHLVSIGTNKEPRVGELAEELHDVGRGRRPRDPVGRPRRVAGREVHRRRAARHALDRDDQPALAGGRRGRGHPAGDRQARGRAARGRPGLAGRERPATCPVATPSARQMPTRLPIGAASGSPSASMTPAAASARATPVAGGSSSSSSPAAPSSSTA